jgi:transcriptional regulator with XRE-family HTH domain
VYKYTVTKKQRKTQKAIAEIMAVAKRTQSQLAKDIGASESTVKSWTRKKNPLRLSRDLKTRIFAAYGAMIDESGRLFAVVNGAERPFTKDSFDGWREHLANAKRPFYSGQSIVSYFCSRAADSLFRVFRAASEKDNGRADKFFAVVESFNQWAESTIKDFKLSKSNQFHPRYLPMMKSVTPENSLPPDFAANFIIEKGSLRHNAHIEYLKAAAKKGDKAAIANLKQHGIEADKTAEKLRR